MTFYILLGFVLIGLSFLGGFATPSYSGLIRWSMFGLLLLLATVRYEVGSDFDTYAAFYVQPTPEDNFEFIYYPIIYILKFFQLPQPAFFGLMSLGVLAPVWKAARRKGDFFYISILLFVFMGFYTESLNIARNFIAIGIIVGYGLDPLQTRNFKKYLLVVFVACLFHLSALFCLPIYFLAARRYNLWVVLGSLLVAFALNNGILIDQIVGVLMKVLPAKYAGYVQYLPQYLSELNEPFWLRIVNNMDKVLIFGFLYAYRKRLVALDYKNHILINLAFFSLTFAFFSRGIGPLQRIGFYFSIFSILSAPLLVQLGQGKVQKMIIGSCLVIVYFAYFIAIILMKNLGETVPYQTIFG